MSWLLSSSAALWFFSGQVFFHDLRTGEIEKSRICCIWKETPESSYEYTIKEEICREYKEDPNTLEFTQFQECVL